MAKQTKSSAARSKRRSPTQSEAETRVTEAVDRTMAEGQRFANAWAAAFSVSVRAWTDVMRASAAATAKAAQAFDDELNKNAPSQ